MARPASQPKSVPADESSSDEEAVVSQASAASSSSRKRKAEVLGREAKQERSHDDDEEDGGGGIRRDSSGQMFVSLGPENRKTCKRVTVSQFRRETYVSVREFYRDNEGEWKHGRKGVALPVHLWKELLAMGPTVDSMIEQL